MEMNRTDYFCLKYDTAVAAQLEVRIAYTLQDGTHADVMLDWAEKQQLFSLIKCHPAEGVLYIACKSPTLPAPLVSMELMLESRMGSVEALGLSYGVAVFDRQSISYVPQWAGSLRYDHIRFTVEENAVQIGLSMQQRFEKSKVLTLEKPVAVTETPSAEQVPSEDVSDLLGHIEADLAILAYYTGSACEQARSLLHAAKERAAADPTAAKKLMQDAEAILCGEMEKNLQALRVYRDHM